MENKFKNLIIDVSDYLSDQDVAKIKKAWEFAKLAHTGQKRRSGEAYVNHPLEIAITLASWRLDATTIVAGLLHDTIEDGGATREDIVKEFGEDVALLVDGVTKVSNLRLKDKVSRQQKGVKQELFAENLRKMLLVMAKDVRVVLVKFADRLHNMETLAALPEDKQKENSRETLEVYAPLAERLGIGKVKGYLEDLSFQYLYPEEYKQLLSSSKPFYKEAEKHIEKMKKHLLKKMAEEQLRPVINGRKKHLYSLWKKLQRPEISGDFNKIHDIIALRILVEKVPDCYIALGAAHNSYKPVPSIGVSDFIAQPKPNGYRSIHTKVFGPEGRIVEVQIRTFEMHDQAEFGVAAHWSYSQAKTSGASDETLEKKGVVNKLDWVKQLVDWQKQIKDTDEYLDAVKFDALEHRNFVFSPKGDVFDLPSGATPIDFAYEVHTSLGKYIQGAKVDGKIVPLDYKLRSGQVVEIIKSKNPRKPTQDWLNFVATTHAKREIRKALDS
ncbi:MAG: RelA/SpoT family protein [Patescibacteria group bacterium]